VDACNPLLQAHPTWARDKHEGRGISPLTPVSLRLPPPFALRLAPTHLGWGTRRQFTRRSRYPRVLKRRQVSCKIKIYYKPLPSGTLAFSLQIRLLIISGIPLEALGHHIYSILYAPPGGVFGVDHRTCDHRLQGDGRIMAPEARQDVLYYCPAESTALSLQAGAKDLVQASEAVGGGIQHRERVRNGH
jgi:hypothetical protein